MGDVACFRIVLHEETQGVGEVEWMGVQRKITGFVRLVGFGGDSFRESGGQVTLAGGGGVHPLQHTLNL